MICFDLLMAVQVDTYANPYTLSSLWTCRSVEGNGTFLGLSVSTGQTAVLEGGAVP